MAMLATAALFGCGGDSEATGGDEFVVRASTTMSPGKLSKPEFIAKMTRVCRVAWKTILDNFEQYYGWQSRKMGEQKRFSKTVRLSLMAGIDFHIFDDYRFTGAPPGDEKVLEEVIGPMQEAVERGQRLGPLHSVAEITDLFSEYNRRAARYGLDECLVDRAHLQAIEEV